VDKSLDSALDARVPVLCRLSAENQANEGPAPQELLADVGMIQGRCCFGLASKSLNRGRVLLGLWRQKFQRNNTLQTGLYRSTGSISGSILGRDIQFPVNP